MDTVKNYALKMLRESKENSPSKRKALKSESRIKRARKFRSEAAQDWYFNPSDQGLSCVPSYSPGRLVHLRDDLTPDDWNDIKNIEGMNAMIPNSVLEYGTDDSNLEGTFSLTYSEGEYGFESYYGEDLDLMFYGYTKTIDELKDLVAKFVPYMADMTFEEIPFEDFAKRVSGVNSDDSEVAESADSESWRTEWKKGTGNDFAYDHNAPLLFKQTPDGEVSLTLGKNPYDGEEGYVGEMDFPEDFIVETGATVEEVLNKLSNYGAVDNYFDLNMPSQDLLNYIESSNEEDFSMDDVSITVQENANEALDYTEELDDLVDGNCLKLCDYLSDFLSPESVKHFYQYVRERVAEEKADLMKTEETDSESWRSQWKLGKSKKDLQYYDNTDPFLYMADPDKEVTLTLGEDPLRSPDEETYIGQFTYHNQDSEDDIIIEQGWTIKEVIDALKTYEDVTDIFNVEMPPADLLSKIGVPEEDY